MTQDDVLLAAAGRQDSSPAGAVEISTVVGRLRECDFRDASTETVSSMLDELAAAGHLTIEVDADRRLFTLNQQGFDRVEEIEQGSG